MVTNHVRQEIIWIVPKKFQMLLTRMAPLKFLIRVQAFQDRLHGHLPHVQIIMNDVPNPLTWDAQLLSYCLSRNPTVFRDYLVNLINNLRGGHCFVSLRAKASQVEKSRCLNWTTQFLTVAYDSAYSPNVYLRLGWISFEALLCRKNLMTVRVSMLLKSRALHDMHPFSPCNKKRFSIWHMNRPLFTTTLSIPSYDIGK